MVNGPTRVDHNERWAPEPRSQRLINAPWIILVLIAAFVAVHLWRQSLDKEAELLFTLKYAFSPARFAAPADLAGYSFPGGEAANIWAFVSHALLHGDWVHLIVNSVWMLAFGSVVARRLGTLRFVVFSAMAAAAGAATNLLVYWGNFAILVGASGAISGQMGATIRLMFAGQQRLADLNMADTRDLPVLSLADLVRDRRAMTFIAVWIVLNLVLGFTGIGVGGAIQRIAWEAHLGGFICGLLLFSWFDRRFVR